MPTINDDCHVDMDDVAFLQALIARDAVAHHMIDRGADGFGITAIAERRGYGATLHSHIIAQPVQLFSGDAGHNEW